jgi:GTPase-associated system helical domain
MIQEYLNAQFIQTTEDANFEKLKKTCVDVAKKISKDKAKILVYSLVAFDPEVPADNKHIVETKAMVIENWQTFLSNSKDTPLTIIRAVMLDALQVASKDISSACLIWFASRNAFKYYKLGREKDILTSFLKELGNRIEGEVSESWNFSPDYQIDIPKVSAAVIEDNDFTAGLTAATVKEATNKALRKQISDLKENQEDFVDQIGLMQMRTQLLWWKEAGYSPSLKVYYKNVKDGQLPVLLAYDYSNFIPKMYPVSVDYFLLETLKGLSASPEKKIKISEFLKTVEQNSSELRSVLPDFTSDEGRISFVNFIRGVMHGNYQANQFKSLVGIADTTELTFGELTLWLFHDLHSIKLSTSK